MEQQLRRILSDLFDLQEDLITDETSIDNTSKWDSLKHMQLILSIEDRFDLEELSMDDIVTMTSFGRIKDVLRNKGLTLNP
jgi:acyl carrier protein